MGLSIDVVNNQTQVVLTILKDDRGVCKTAISSKEVDENGEEKTIFTKLNIQFKKDVEVKNKSKIAVKKGFMSFFKIKTDETNENGKPKYDKHLKFIVLDFDLLEEGIDENYQTKKYSEQKTTNASNTFDDYYANDDDLPF